MRASSCARSVASVGTTVASPPAARIRSATPSRSLIDRAARTTAAPPSAKADAVAAPIPRLAPVTIETLIGPPPSAAAPMRTSTPYSLSLRSSLRSGARSSKGHHRPGGGARAQGVVAGVDVVEVDALGDKGVELEPPLEVVASEQRDVVGEPRRSHDQAPQGLLPEHQRAAPHLDGHARRGD